MQDKQYLRFDFKQKLSQCSLQFKSTYNQHLIYQKAQSHQPYRLYNMEFSKRQI